MISDVARDNFLKDLQSNYFVKGQDGNFTACTQSTENAIKCSFRSPPVKGNLRGKPLAFVDLKRRFKKPLDSAEKANYVKLNEFDKDFGSCLSF